MKIMTITELPLTQQEANQLITELKELAKKVSGTIENGATGIISIISKNDKRKFKIAYFYSR